MKRIVAAICVIVVVISVMLIVRTGCQENVKIQLGGDRCIGAFVASETAKLIDDKGSIIVIARVNNDPRDPEAEAQVEAFKKELKQHGQIHIEAVLTPGPRDAYPPANGMLGQYFLQIVNDHPDVTGIVSFVGIPFLDPGGPPIDASRLPRVLALSDSRISVLAGVIENGVVSEVLFRRRFLAWDITRKPKNCQEVVDPLYVVVNKANYAEMAQTLREPPGAQP